MPYASIEYESALCNRSTIYIASPTKDCPWCYKPRPNFKECKEPRLTNVNWKSRVTTTTLSLAFKITSFCRQKRSIFLNSTTMTLSGALWQIKRKGNVFGNKHGFNYYAYYTGTTYLSTLCRNMLLHFIPHNFITPRNYPNQYHSRTLVTTRV